MDRKLRNKQTMGIISKYYNTIKSLFNMNNQNKIKNVNYKTFQANSGAIRFTMTVDSLPNPPDCPEIYLIADECPHEKLFTINFDYHNNKTINIQLDKNTTKSIQIPNCLLSLKSTEMWLSWYNNHFHMGLVDGGAFVTLLSNPLIKIIPTVGFIRFKCSVFIKFDVKDPPVAVTDTYKQIEGGKLRWFKMSSGDQLPIDALIGGFEAEPIYVARAKHNGSICPGKFVPSKQLAYIPWGHEEHAKHSFEVLCGYNLMWIKCRSPYLPDNAFKAGKSEVRNEPLYIGRAMIDDHLIIGKVHMLYELCYLPYNGREISKNIYEVMVVGNSETSEHNWKKKCFMLNCEQPCS